MDQAAAVVRHSPALMRIYALDLENIGPFDEAHIEFSAEGEASPGVTLLTGRNGTGKTIVLDAIRAFFGPQYGVLERSIVRKGVAFHVDVTLDFDASETSSVRTVRLDRLNKAEHIHSDLGGLNNLPRWMEQTAGRPPPWVVDFWRSQPAPEDQRIQSLSAIQHHLLYTSSLQGQVDGAHVTQLLCHFDYLRDSRTPRERATGEALYALAEKILRFALLDGELVGIERLTFTPMVRQGAHAVPLANVSSGNAYLVQRMISLLGRMYSLHVLRETDPATIHEAPGLLLIDEAENQFHPEWQKRFLPGVRDIFPNLQIIATTHSPFVLASVPDARVYVCHYDPATRRTTVREETAAYQSKPVDEILASSAFDHTQPFGPEITALLTERKRAVAAKDEAARDEVERKLVELNPTYFGYLDLDRRLEALRKAG
jgi:predicted ATPase